MPTKDELQQALDAAESRNTALQDEILVLQQLLDALPDLVLYKDSESQIRYANLAFREYYGMAQDDLHGLRDLPGVPDELYAQYRQDDAFVLESGESFTTQEPVTRNGEVVGMFDTTKRPIYNASNQIIGSVGVSRDITSHLEALEVLQQTEERMARLVTHVPGMVYEFEIDLAGTARFLYASPGSVDIYGLTPEEIMGDSAALIGRIHPDDQLSFQTTVAESMQTLNPWIWEGRTATPRGDQWVNGYSRPERMPDGSTRWVGVVVDATEAKRAQELQQRFAEVVAATPDLVAMYDQAGQTLYINPAGKAMLGYGAETDLAEIAFASHYRPAEREQFINQHVPAAHREGRWVGETALVSRQGQEVPVSLVIVPHRSASNEGVLTSVMARDLSIRRRNEQEQKRLQEEVIRMQALAIAELSTPLIALNARTVLMPLIGTIDSQRSQQIIETVLSGVAEHQAETAIIDLTGVPLVDTQVASALVRAAQAVRLLGASVVLTGIRPEIAQTLVGLGVDLGEVITRANLHAGIEYALGRR